MSPSNAPRVSACIIVKDEQDFIEQCLESVRGVVDEIVVYDTGSTDRTIELAEATGARVIRGYWDDDFGRARNAALAECRGTWVLQLDADEVATFDRGELQRGLAMADAFDVLLLEIRNVGARGGEYSHYNRRLFRRRRAHWVGRLHERVESRDRRPLREANLPACVIVHHGYAEELIEARGKSERNVRIALAELDAAGPDEDRGALLVNVARSYGSAGDQEQALEQFRRAATIVGSPKRSTALRLGAEILMDRKEFDEARTWIDEFEAAGGGAQVVAFLRGSVDLLEGRPAHLLADLADLDELIPEDGMGIPERQLRLRTAMALTAVQRWDAAAPALLGLLSEDPELTLWGLLATSLVQGDLPLDDAVAAIPEERLRQVLAQILLEPVETGEAFGRAVADRFGDDLRIVAFAVQHGPRLEDLEDMLPWATVIRNGHLEEHCPVVGRAADPTTPVPERFMAAVVAHAAFRDPRAVGLLDDLATKLDPADEPAAIHVLQELAPDLVIA